MGAQQVRASQSNDGGNHIAPHRSHDDLPVHISRRGEAELPAQHHQGKGRGNGAQLRKGGISKGQILPEGKRHASKASFFQIADQHAAESQDNANDQRIGDHIPEQLLQTLAFSFPADKHGQGDNRQDIHQRKAHCRQDGGNRCRLLSSQDARQRDADDGGVAAEGPLQQHALAPGVLGGQRRGEAAQGKNHHHHHQAEQHQPPGDMGKFLNFIGIEKHLDGKQILKGQLIADPYKFIRKESLLPQGKAKENQQHDGENGIHSRGKNGNQLHSLCASPVVFCACRKLNRMFPILLEMCCSITALASSASPRRMHSSI